VAKLRLLHVHPNVDQKKLLRQNGQVATRKSVKMPSSQAQKNDGFPSRVIHLYPFSVGSFVTNQGFGAERRQPAGADGVLMSGCQGSFEATHWGVHQLTWVRPNSLKSLVGGLEHFLFSIIYWE